MNSPDYSSGLYVCPRDYSVHHLSEATCNFCGWQFSRSDIHATTSLKVCPTCQVYVGSPALKCMNCGAAFPSIYSGVGTGPYQAQPSYANAYPRQNLQYSTDLPPSIQSKFNWGAFFLSWIWGLNHRKPETLLVILAGIIPFGALVGCIYIGFKGNEWAWASGRFQTVDDMLACQSIWAKWGLAFFLFSFLAPCFLFLIFGLAGAAGSH